MERRAHADSKRDEIFQAAIRLFARQGFDGTSVKDIARAAGVTDAAIYKHFASKEQLAEAVYGTYADRYTRLLDLAAGRPGPFRERLDALVAEVIRLQTEDPFGLLLIGDWHRLPAGRRGPAAALAAFIAGGIHSGEIPPQDPVLTGGLFFGAMLRLTVWCVGSVLEGSLADRLSEIQERVRGLFGLH